MAVILSDAFTGTNGDAWNASNWTTRVEGATGSATIQTNRGRLNPLTGAYTKVIALAAPASGTVDDFDVTFSWADGTTGEQYLDWYYRVTTNVATGIPASCFLVSVDHSGDQVLICSIDSGGTLSTGVTVFTAGLSDTARHWMRVRVVGTQHKVKWWNDGSGEPGTWQIDETDPDAGGWTTGRVLLAQTNGASGTSRNADFDDFSLDDLITTDPAPAVVAVAATIPAPTVKASATPKPTTVAVSATIPAPTVAVRTTPAVRSAASTGVSAACTTGVTVTKPSGVADGDVLFAFVSKTNYADTNAFTCSGWTEISSGTRGTTTGNDRHVTILRKVITNAAGEGSNYTFVTTFGTTCSMCATIICVSGADTTTPEDISVPSITFGSNDATPASRDSTSVTAGALVLSYCQLSLGTTAVKTWGAPSGYTAPSGGDTSVVASSLNNQHGVAYKTLATAGAAGTNVWTHTADDANTENSRAIVIVRPAATTIVTPAVVACAATIPAPTIDTTVSGDATATPSVVAISAAVPSPTVTTTATPTPAVVAVSATVPAPVVSASASVLASVVSVAASVFAVTILATATVAPSLVSAAATIPAPTITATATVTPDVVPISATVPAPTITVGTIITPSTVAALATVPSPTVTGSATVTPSAVAVSATIPSPAVTTSATVTPTAVAVSATIPSPTITATATVAPSAVAISATVPAPTITATATVTPSVVPITVTVSAPTITTGTIVDPSVVPITVVVPAPTITGSATVEPSAVTVSATVPAPTISASTNATATPTTVDVAATLSSPTITATATVTPTTVAASATIPAPTITTTVTVAPSVVPITVTVSAPTITATGTPTPATVAITASVGAPVIDAASAIGDPGIVCLAVTVADVTLTATAPTVALATTAPTVTLAVTCATLELVATCATVALTFSEDC